MGKRTVFSPKDKHTYRTAFVAFTLICVLMGVLLFQYYKQLQSTVQDESSGYMQEIAKQMGTNINKNINDNFAVLSTIATVLQNSNTSSYEQLQRVIREQQSYWNFQKVMLIDQNGVTYDDSGQTVSLSSGIYMQDAVVSRKPSLSTSQNIDSKDCIVFAIPISTLTIDNTSIVALAASYDLSTFDQILSMTAFGGRGYAHIIREDGTVIIRSSAKNASETGYNILSSLETAQIHSDQTVEAVRADIENGKSGQTELTLDGNRQYMTYTPLNTRDWYLLTFVPVEVVNTKSHLLLSLTLLMCSLLMVAFSLLTAFLMFSFYRNKRKLEQIAYVDAVTGGNTIERFYELAQEALDAPGRPQYALVYSNIEKFKVLNEQFGRNTCDDTLRSIDRGVTSRLQRKECMGRLFADNFCVLIEYTDKQALAARFEDWYEAVSEDCRKNGSIWLAPVIESGVYVIGNDTMPFPPIIDRAKLALSEAAQERNGKLRYAIYDEQMRLQLFREKQLEDVMERALADREFQVYLQPKYYAVSETVGGAEALVRWISPTEGMVYPDEFISLFERNGFIVQLDLWVFEEVCRALRRWLDAGITPVKVSVNCSRVHLKDPRFLDPYCQLSAQYHLPPGLIEIELTETTVFGDVDHLIQTINQIHQAGFGCSMDDFGSGYSSLNLIRDIPVDTLKLDKIFFRTTTTPERTESVVGSIITMAKALSMVTVAEGVEERAQVEMLQRLHCDYIQGYYFAKPMPIPDFEALTYGLTQSPMQPVCEE